MEFFNLKGKVALVTGKYSFRWWIYDSSDVDF